MSVVLFSPGHQETMFAGGAEQTGATILSGAVLLVVPWPPSFELMDVVVLV